MPRSCRKLALWGALAALLALPSEPLAQCFPAGELHGTTWEWVESIGGVAGVRTTPELLGYTRQVVIDVAAGTWDVYVDEVLELSESVTFDCQEVPGLGEVLIRTGERFEQALKLSQPYPGRPRTLTTQDINVFDGYYTKYEQRGAITPVATFERSWTAMKASFDR